MRAATILLLTLLAAAPARAEGFAVVYDAWFGGLRLGELRLSAAQSGGAWRAEADFSASGALAWFMDARLEAEAEGRGDLLEPRPDRLASRADFRGEAREFALGWRDGRVAEMRAEPWEARPRDVPPEAAGAALDPLSATLALLSPRPEAALCGREAAVYDGRRRFDLALGPPRREADGVWCDGRLTRIAGYKPKQLRGERRVRFFATRWRVEDGRFWLEALHLPLDEGRLVFTRR